MTFKDYLIFIRWKNVLMIVLIQYLFKYVLFDKFHLMMSLDHLHFFLLSFSTVCIAIAGYIVNDIYDVKADTVNKPEKLFVGNKITRSAAQTLFIAINSVGLILGMYLSYYIGHTSYFIIYVLTSLLLYQYAKYLKRKLLISNLIVSFIIFLSVILILAFDLLPSTNKYNLVSQTLVFKILFSFATYGFVLTFIREVVKDIEDIEGDIVLGARTLPIVVGITKTKSVLFGVAIFFLITLTYSLYILFSYNLSMVIYLSIFVGIPMLYFVFKIRKSDSKKEFHQLSGILKLVMLTGILTIILI